MPLDIISTVVTIEGEILLELWWPGHSKKDVFDEKESGKSGEQTVPVNQANLFFWASFTRLVVRAPIV